LSFEWTIYYYFLFLLLAIPEDGVCNESDDEDNVNPDERNPQSITDKRIAPDNEYSDSEDEGMAPGVRGGGRKDNRYSHCFIFTIIIFHVGI